MKKISFFDVIAIFSIVAFIVFANVVQANDGSLFDRELTARVKELVKKSSYTSSVFGESVRDFWKKTYLACRSNSHQVLINPHNCIDVANQSVLEVYDFWKEMK